MAAWLAAQVGAAKTTSAGRSKVKAKARTRAGVRVSTRASAATATIHTALRSANTTTTTSLPFQNTGVAGILSLVRSYQIPTADPLAAQLANLSWTYDSAVSAISFTELGATTQAAQLLSQLAALQRSDGSIDFAYNTATGQSVPEFRAGTIAMAGLAALDYHQKMCSTQYDGLAYGAAQYLLGLQASNGLLNGGPDVTWQSTQHNLIARAFLNDLADVMADKATTVPADVVAGKVGGEAYPVCSGASTSFDGLSAPAATSAFVTKLRTAVSAIDSGIQANLFVRLTSSTGTGLGSAAGTAYFREGTNDDIRPVDAQALGILWLLGQNRLADAQAVLNYTNATMLKSSFTVGLSTNVLSFNNTYTGSGTYMGYTPYDTLSAPATPQRDVGGGHAGDGLRHPDARGEGVHRQLLRARDEPGELPERHRNGDRHPGVQRHGHQQPLRRLPRLALGGVGGLAAAQHHRLRPARRAVGHLGPAPAALRAPERGPGRTGPHLGPGGKQRRAQPPSGPERGVSAFGWLALRLRGGRLARGRLLGGGLGRGRGGGGDDGLDRRGLHRRGPG